jgi:hypothetical protein
MATLQKKKEDELFGGGSRSKNPDGLGRKELKEIEDEIKQVDKDLDQLRALYELYFMGVERTEPVVSRDKVRRRLRSLRDMKFKNNGFKFKVQAMQARMISFENYWGRIMRQREAGTYKRDRTHVKRHLAKHAATAEAAQEEKKTVQKRPSNHSARPTASSAEDLTESKLKQIYRSYSTAKKKCGQKVDVSFQDLANNLKKQVPRLIKSSGAKHVEFKVVIKQGKAVLKAIPKS